ncbi:MAG: hypothetical protein K8L97_34855, partial [Anaerolineae bacterium]|nr:hypothetical protein [Anaerolineae bacterium]
MFKEKGCGKGVHRQDWFITTTNRGQNDELRTTIPVGKAVEERIAECEQLASGQYGVVQLWDHQGAELPTG